MITIKTEFPPDNLDADFNKKFIQNLTESVSYISCDVHGTDCDTTLLISLTAPGFKYDVVNPCCPSMKTKLIHTAIRVLYATQFPS